MSASLPETGVDNDRRGQMLSGGTEHLPRRIVSSLLQSSSESCLVKASLFILMAQGLNPIAAPAQSAPKNLDLSSTVASETASRAGTITIGGAAHQVKVGDLITPAERVALAQVFFNNGNQNIVLGAQGNAVGGSLNISYAAANGASNLVIPQNVVAVQDLGRLSTLNVTGNLLNSGTLQIISQNASINSALIYANNITNMQGGVITSVLPAAGLAGYNPVLNSVHLALNAVHNISNFGIISSSGNLSMTAGGTISNSGVGALMQAQNNVSMFANVIQNSALLQSLAGNINIAALLAQNATANLNLNLTGGTLEALQGAINIGDLSRLTSTNISVTGGDFLSQQLNFEAEKCGIVQANLGQVSGVVNAYCQDIVLNAVSSQLNLGAIQFTNDPIITQQQGNDIIVLQADSASNITFQSQGNLIIRCNVISTGGYVQLIAGQNITAQNISAASFVLADARGSISTGNISAPGSISVHAGDQTVQSVGTPPSSGNISVGVITTPSVSLQSDNGTISYQSITAQSVGLQVNTSTVYTPNLAAITFAGNSPNSNGISIFNMGSGGVTINQALTVPGTSSQGGSIDIESASGPVFIGADLTAQTASQPLSALSGGIILSSGRSITIAGANLNARGSAGNSAGYVNISTNNLIVTGNSNINVDANGGPGSGSASLSSYSTGAALLVSGGGKLTVNADAPQGSSISLTAGSLQIDPTTSVYMHADGNASQFANNVNVIASGGPANSLGLGNGPGQLQVSSNSASTGAGGGMVYVGSSGDLVYNLNGASASASASGNSSGGQITLAAGLSGSGNLVLNSGINLNGSGNGSGGNMTLTAANKISNSSVQSFTSNSGAAGGNSGNITMQSKGNLALANVSLDASNSAGGAAGNISVSAGGDLSLTGATVNSNSKSAAAGNISVLAGTMQAGVLTFDGNLTANSGGTAAAGNISLGQNSLTAMQLGIPTIPGQAASGSISASSSFGSGGTLTLTAGSSPLNVALNENVSLSGSAVNKMGTLNASSSNGINISGPASFTGNVNASASSFSLVTSGAGSTIGVNSVTASSGNVTLKATAADGNLVFATNSSIAAPAGAIEIGAPSMSFLGNSKLSMGTAGVMKINSGNQSSSLAMSFASGSIVTFNVTQGTSLRPGNIQIGPNGSGSLTMSSGGTSDLEFTGGTVSISSSSGNINLGQGLSLNSNAFDTTQNLGVELVATKGDININSAISARQLNVSTVSSGNINFSAALMAPTIILSTQGSGAINQSGNGSVGIGTLVMSTQTGDLGSQLNPINANVLELQVNTGGSAYIKNASTLGVRTSSVAGAFQLSNTGDVSIESSFSAGTLSIASSGNIDMFGSTTGSNGVAMASGAGKTVYVAAGASLSSAAGSVNISTDNLVLNGGISGVGQLAVNSNGTLSLSGSAASLTASGSGALISLNGSSSVSFGSSYTLNAGPGGTVQVQTASLSTGGVVVAGGSTLSIAGGSQFNVLTNALTLGAGSSLSLSNASNAMSVISTAGAPLQINVASSLSTSINSSGGGAVQFVAGTGAALVFQSSGLNSGTLSVTGGNLLTTSSAADTSLNNVNLSSSKNIQVAVNGGTLNLNGNITSGQSGGVIVLQDPNGITIAGNGTVGFSSGLSGSILVQALSAGAVLKVSGNPVFNAGANGSLSFSAVGQIIFDNSTQVKATAASININAPSLVMGAKSGLAASTAANFNIGGYNGSGLSIILPAADSASLSTAAGGQFNISTAAGSSINFSQSSTSATASTLNFSGGALSVSTSKGNVTIDANVVLNSDNNISVSTPGGSLINNGLIQGTGQTTVISEAGDLLINQGINAYSLLIQTTANNGTITLSANVNVIKDLRVSANGSGNIYQTSGLLSADSISLISGSGNIGSSNGRIQVKTNTLSVNTAGSAFVNAQGPVTLSSYNVGGGLNLSATGNISIGAGKTSTLSIVTSGIFDAGKTGTVSLSAMNAINISAGVSIQVKNSALNISSPTITAGTGARIKADGNISILGSLSAGKELRIRSNSGSLSFTGAVSGTNLLYFAADKGITFDGDVSSASRLILDVESSGGVTQLSGSLKAPSIELDIDGGNVGSARNPLNVIANSIEVRAERGSVNINAIGAITVEDSESFKDFNLTSSGSLSVENVLSLNGSVSLTGAGRVQVQESGTVMALHGNLLIRNTDAAKGTIFIGSDANLIALSDSAGSGNVNLVVGNMPSSFVSGSQPNNVSTSQLFGGNVYFGKSGITANGSDNSINAWGANVVFSAANKSQITLDGGVFILADPPVSQTMAALPNASGAPGSTLSASVFQAVTPAVSQVFTQTINNNLIMPMPGAGIRAIKSQAKSVETQPINKEDERQELRPISCVTTVPSMELSSAQEQIKALTTSTGTIYARGSEYTIDASGISFKRGEMLIDSPGSSSINTSSGIVHVSRGACVLLKSNGKGLEIFNVHENHWGCVKVLLNGREFVVGAGQTFQVNQDSHVAVRNGQTHWAANQSAKIAEFNLVSLLAKSNLLPALTHSEIKEHKQLSARIYKTAACLSVVTASHGPYKN